MNMLYNTTLINNASVKHKYISDFAAINPYNRYSSEFKVPKQFNSIKIWKDFLSPVQNQGNCGSCFAFALSSTLSDRIALITNNEIHIQLSSVNITICPLPKPGQDLVLSSFNSREINRKDRLVLEKDDHNIHSCKGNNLLDTSKFMYYVGANLTNCVPNSITTTTGTNLLTCENVEDTLSTLTFNGCYKSDKAQRDFRIKYIYRLDLTNQSIRDLNIQYEIYKFGPITTGFIVYDDFYEYSNNIKNNKKLIYTHSNKNTKSRGGHSVAIIGWGEEIQDNQLVSFWLVRNSWGINWGDNGFFRMQRWIVECQLEHNIICSIPDLVNTQNLDLPEPLENSIIPGKTERNLRDEYVIDPYTFYSLSTLEAIKQGKLYGSLQPIFMEDRLPVVNEKFIAGKLSVDNILFRVIIYVLILLVLFYKIRT